MSNERWGIDGYYDIDDAGCWLWRGKLDRQGYAQIRRLGERWLAHRYSWTLTNGPIPEGLTVDHICFTRSCVNPEHLQPLTHADNVRRQRRWINRTTCDSGLHEWNDENVIVNSSNGRRHCRLCRNARVSARYHASKEVAA